LTTSPSRKITTTHIFFLHPHNPKEAQKKKKYLNENSLASTNHFVIHSKRKVLTPFPSKKITTNQTFFLAFIPAERNPNLQKKTKTPQSMKNKLEQFIKHHLQCKSNCCLHPHKKNFA
jgi:hypothetical protein